MAVAAWLNGNGIGHINEVALCWVRLVLNLWLCLDSTPSHKKLSWSNQPPRQLNLAIPPGLPAYWPIRLKALAINWAGHPANMGGMLA